MKILRFSSTV